MGIIIRREEARHRRMRDLQNHLKYPTLQPTRLCRYRIIESLQLVSAGTMEMADVGSKILAARLASGWLDVSTSDRYIR